MPLNAGENFRLPSHYCAFVHQKLKTIRARDEILFKLAPFPVELTQNINEDGNLEGNV